MKLIFGILLVIVTAEKNLFAAEAGMPQLDPKYWASQACWLTLIFTCLYLSIAKIFIPKIKDGLDNRDNKIKSDLDDAKVFKENSEKKLKEYLLVIEEAKKSTNKIVLEVKKKLDQDIQDKKKILVKQIEDEITKAQNEILKLKKDSINDIKLISESITMKIIEDISGDKLNESSIKASIDETTKIKLKDYL